MDVGAGEQVDGPLLPVAAAQEMLALGDAPRRGHHQRKAEVGGRFGQHVGRVREQYATCCAGRHVDVVVAGRHAADRAQLRAAIEQGRIDRLRAGDEGADLALQMLGQFVAAPLGIGLVRFDLEVRVQALERFRQDASANKDGRLHRRPFPIR